jgi:hypothetical protein
VTQEYSDFFILTGDEEFEWVFKNDGELMFPDGTLFGEVGASGTIGFVTEEDSDFSIATSSSNNDYEWQFTKDGVFKLPGLTGSASFRVINDAPFFSPVALQITSPNALVIKSPTKTWNFEANGNTTFPADFAVGGALKVNWGGVSENIFDIIIHKFESETITITDNTPVTITSFNAATSQVFDLNFTPRSLAQVAMFLNGERVPRDKFSLSASEVTYTKTITNYQGSVDVRFDYFKN